MVTFSVYVVPPGGGELHHQFKGCGETIPGIGEYITIPAKDGYETYVVLYIMHSGEFDKVGMYHTVETVVQVEPVEPIAMTASAHQLLIDRYREQGMDVKKIPCSGY